MTAPYSRPLSLVRPDESYPDLGGNLPDYAEHDGRQVRWTPWEQAPTGFVCGSSGCWTHSCEECGSTERPWSSGGELLPAPGETVTCTERRTRSGRRYEGASYKVPAWPHLRLVAYRCPACRDVRVYDVGGPDGFEEIDLTRPVLF